MSEPSTRERLLDEAEALFADRGYESVTVRDIAAAAEANIAAVNYHFQGKENLYHEVLRRRIVPKRDKLLAAVEAIEAEHRGERKLEHLFRAFISTHLDDALRGRKGAEGLRLLSREMSDPRHGAQIVVKELIEPVRSRFLALVAGLMPELTASQCQLLMGTVVSQVIYFAMNWHNLQAHTVRHGSKLGSPLPDIASDRETYINTVIDHVTLIAVAGAEAMQKEAEA